MTHVTRLSRTVIPTGVDDATLRVSGRDVHLTNLRKPFWPALGITKGTLLQYYVDVAAVLLPHVRDRPMVMKRYPHGAEGAFFFMKRAPKVRPGWIRTCGVEHRSGKVIDFPLVDDLPSLLWVVNLGCIDLNPWHARCDAPGQPDVLYFDLDPGEGTTFDQVRACALAVGDALRTLGMRPLVKTSGSTGMHLAVPIVRGPTQEQVRAFAKALALTLAPRYPSLMTTEYRVASRPKGRVLLDYNQNRRGSTLAGVYSVRPRPGATVSTPVTWTEVGEGASTGDFQLDNVPARVRRLGDLWKPLVRARGRTNLGVYFRGDRRTPRID